MTKSRIEPLRVPGKRMLLTSWDIGHLPAWAGDVDKFDDAARRQRAGDELNRLDELLRDIGRHLDAGTPASSLRNDLIYGQALARSAAMWLA